MSIEDDGPEGVAEEDAYAPAPGQLSTDEDESDFSPFDEPGDEYAGEPIQKVMGADGLPTVTASLSDTDIPPLSPETLVCMGDYSEFMMPDGKALPRSEVEPSGNGPPLTMEWRAKGSGDVVEPKRRPCAHYVRQLTQLPHNPEHQQLIRLCSARRTTEGAMMSVGERGLWDCDMRSPFHYVGHMDRLDEKKMRDGLRPAQLFVFQKEKETPDE